MRSEEEEARGSRLGGGTDGQWAGGQVGRCGGRGRRAEGEEGRSEEPGKEGLKETLVSCSHAFVTQGLHSTHPGHGPPWSVGLLDQIRGPCRRGHGRSPLRQKRRQPRAGRLNLSSLSREDDSGSCRQSRRAAAAQIGRGSVPSWKQKLWMRSRITKGAISRGSSPSCLSMWAVWLQLPRVPRAAALNGAGNSPPHLPESLPAAVLRASDCGSRGRRSLEI